MIHPVAFALILVRIISGLSAPAATAIPSGSGPPAGYVLVKIIRVPAEISWTDTGLDVLVDQEFWFEAAGTISLQAGNAEAYCGPDGLDVQTLQQPDSRTNLGCLVGRILQYVETTEDKVSKEQTVKEFGTVFFVGPSGPARIPADGRLQLGPNENVTGDNDGAFSVRIYMRN